MDVSRKEKSIGRSVRARYVRAVRRNRFDEQEAILAEVQKTEQLAQKEIERTEEITMALVDLARLAVVAGTKEEVQQLELQPGCKHIRNVMYWGYLAQECFGKPLI